MSFAALLHSLWMIAAAAGLVGSAATIGQLAFDRLSLNGVSRLERLVFGSGIGLGLCSGVVFALGMLSLLAVWTLRAVVALMAAAAIVALLRRGTRLAPAIDSPEQTAGPCAEPPEPLAPSPEHRVSQDENRQPAWIWAFVIVAGVVLLCAAFSCLSPMVDYDGLSYHVAAPKRWLELGALRSLPTHLHTEWPMGFEMLYLMLLPVSGPDGSKILMAFLAALTAITVFLLGRRLASTRVGAVGAALTLIAAGPDKINTTSIEIPLAFFVALSALALIARQGSQSADRPRWLVLAAICAGFGNCTKLNGLLATAMLAAAVCLGSRERPESWRKRASDALVFVLLAVATVAPWYLRAWHDTGSPVFPFGWPLLGGRHWTGDASRTLTLYFRYFDLPGDSLSARQSVLIRHTIRLFAVVAIAIALPSPPRLRAAAAITGLYAILQTLTSDQARFFLPALPFAAVFAAWWLVWLAKRWRRLGVAAAAAAALYALPAAARAAWSDAPIIAGLRPRGAYIRHYVNVAPACEWANITLPASARVLFGLDTRTFFLERDAYWSSSIVQRQIPFDTPTDGLMDTLRQAGVGYLIYNRALLRVDSVRFEMRNLGRDRESAGLEAIANRSMLLWQSDDVSVYRLPDSRPNRAQSANERSRRH